MKLWALITIIRIHKSKDVHGFPRMPSRFLISLGRVVACRTFMFSYLLGPIIVRRVPGWSQALSMHSFIILRTISPRQVFFARLLIIFLSDLLALDEGEGINGVIWLQHRRPQVIGHHGVFWRIHTFLSPVELYNQYHIV